MATIKYHTKKEALKAVTEDGYELAFCTSELKNNEDVVMAAIKQNSWSFCYASLLRSKKAFVIKALNEGVNPRGLLDYANISFKFDFEVISLALEKSKDGWEFQYSKGEVALNKELAAKALIKWGNTRKLKGGADHFVLWKKIHPTLQEFFPKDSFHEKAQSYLIQLKEEKQAEIVSGGCKDEDEVVW